MEGKISQIVNYDICSPFYSTCYSKYFISCLAAYRTNPANSYITRLQKHLRINAKDRLTLATKKQRTKTILAGNEVQKFWVTFVFLRR